MALKRWLQLHEYEIIRCISYILTLRLDGESDKRIHWY